MGRNEVTLEDLEEEVGKSAPIQPPPSPEVSRVQNRIALG